jgi:hypothetical protein
MALMKCPECSREVSDSAEACPQCAYPIAGKKVATGAESTSADELQRIYAKLEGATATASMDNNSTATNSGRSSSTTGFVILVVVVLLVAVGGYFYKKENEKEGIRNEIVSVLKSAYGYSDSGFNFNMKSYRKDGPGEYAVISVSYLPENLSWDVACSKIGDVMPWDRAPEQRGKDLKDLEEIGNCLNSLAGGLRIGDNVYNSKNEVNSCRDAIKLYNIKHPKSQMQNIGG